MKDRIYLGRVIAVSLVIIYLFFLLSLNVFGQESSEAPSESAEHLLKEVYVDLDEIENSESFQQVVEVLPVVEIPETLSEELKKEPIYVDLDEVISDKVVSLSETASIFSENSSGLNVFVLNSSSNLITSHTNLVFSFSVDYENLSNVNCDFGVKNANGTSVYSNSLTSGFSWSLNSSTLPNGNYSWNVYCSDLTFPEMNDSESGNFQIAVSLPFSISFSSSSTNISAGQSVTFYVNVVNAVSLPASYYLYFGDGSSNFSGNIMQSNFNHTITHIYYSPGSFVVNFVGVSGLNNSNFVKYIFVRTNSTNSTNSTDREDPVVTLVYPASNENFNEDKINFSYKATDNVKVANCTFNLYYYNKSSIGSLVYNNFKNNIVHNEEVKLDLRDFDEGDYSWEVGCYDNSTNYDEKSRDFSVNLPDSSEATLTQTKEIKTLSLKETDTITRIDEVIALANDFLVKEDKMKKEEREVLDVLGISEEVVLYKKRLVQMKTDVEHNLAYATPENKEKRINDITAQLEEMTVKIPTGVSVEASNEYLKNTIDFDLEKIVRAYADTKAIVLDESGISKMASANLELQKSLSVNAKAWNAAISYTDRTDKITVVSKEVKFGSSVSFDSVIESIPKETAEKSSDVVFVNSAKELKADNPIFEILKEDLNSERFVYYFKKEINLRDVEKTSTILFKEDLPKSSFGPISGFVTFVGEGFSGGIWFYVSWISALLFIALTFVSATKRYRMRKWKRNPEFKKISEVYKEISLHLKKKEIEVARDKYNKIKEIYPKIPANSKKFVFKKMKRIITEIDKKDIVVMVKELAEAVKEKRKEDAVQLYNKIKSLYGRMDKRFKKKVYTKVSELIKEIK